MDFLSLCVGDHPMMNALIPSLKPSKKHRKGTSLYVKGSNRIMQGWWGSKEHRAFRAWLKKRAKCFDVVVWDGDEVDEANFTNALVTDIPQLVPGVPILAARIVSEAKSEAFKNGLKSTGAVPLLIPNTVVDNQDHRPNGLQDWQWRYVRLGAAAMAKVGPGDVVVLGGGDVPLEEIRHCGAHCHGMYSWHCLRVNGLSSICDAYEKAAFASDGGDDDDDDDDYYDDDAQQSLRKLPVNSGSSSGSARRQVQDSLIEHFDVVPFNDMCLDDGRPFGYTFVTKSRGKTAAIAAAAAAAALSVSPSGVERSVGYVAATEDAALTIRSRPEDDDDSDSYEPLDYSDVFDEKAQQQQQQPQQKYCSVVPGSPTTDSLRSKLASRHERTHQKVEHRQSSEPNTKCTTFHVAHTNNAGPTPGRRKKLFAEKVDSTRCAQGEASDSDDYSCDSDAEISDAPKLPTQAGHGSRHEDGGQSDEEDSYSFSSASSDDGDNTDTLDRGRGDDGKDVNAPGAKKYIASHSHDAAANVVGHCDSAESVSTYDVSSDGWDSDTPSDM